MREVDWAAVFGVERPFAKGCSDAELRGLGKKLLGPLTEAEVSAIRARQKNPWPASSPRQAGWKPSDPLTWRLPTRPLPASYLSFLRWSNGATFGEDDEMDVLDVDRVREELPQVAECMEGALPIAIETSPSTFYLLDMRADAVGGEYPIVRSRANSLDWKEATVFASSFLDFCREIQTEADWVDDA